MTVNIILKKKISEKSANISVDGNEYEMVYGGKVKITKQGDKTFVNGSEVLASIQTSNGWIHVIGDVLLPK